MSRRRREPRLTVEDIASLDGLLSAFDDFSDGAWSAACQDAIEEDPRFDGRDAYEVWLAWCRKNEIKGAV